MARIQQLPSLVISKIAAGEVIERPASVVKELLENSVDAGSRRIDVEIENGGADLIRVVDDGGGIEPDDLPLAFARHATSKLRDADDLFRIGTLGFRGEALASIGGVAQVNLQSRPHARACGAALTCHGGELSPVEPWNGAPGTRMEVRHLFYNTPVRRKFLRQAGTEMGHITETFTRLALPHSRRDDRPGLHLSLRHNGKPVHEVAASAGLRERVRQFFGPAIEGQLYEVSVRKGPLALTGFIADPACGSGTAKMQYLFLNGRWFRDRTLGHAVQEAYRGLLMTGRYAITFLFLDLPPDLVDVNVHPTKSEVRFREGQVLHHLVFTAVRDRLRKENLTPRLQVPSTLRPSAEVGTPQLPWELKAPPDPAPRLPFGAPIPVPAIRVVPPEFGAEPADGEAGLPHADLTPVEPAPASAPQPKIMQLYESYLVLEADEGMLVIDQHALHERILFDQLKRRLRDGALPTQKLLVPDPVELTGEQAARVLEQRAALAELGLGIEDFGGGTVLVTCYPTLLGERSPAELLRAVVDHVMNQERVPTREVLFNDLLSLMACHAAVRAGDRLTPEQMAVLVEQRQLADDVHHCPHGRPTALLFSRHDLERQFRRV